MTLNIVFSKEGILNGTYQITNQILKKLFSILLGT